MGTSIQFGGGVTSSLTKTLSLYGDFSWQTGAVGSGFRGWAGNGGARITF
jgi:outer membrane autotransporter protein